MSTPRIAFIGAGNMAASLIGGLRAQGVPAAQIRASDPGAEQRAKIAGEFAIDVVESNAEAVADADVVVLSVKPQAMKAVCQALAPALKPEQLIVSIAAGIPCASLEAWLGQPRPVVRCMPNTPALLRQGASGLYANAQVSAAQREQAGQLLSAVGIALWLDDEAQIDAVTAVSGSGPAYFFLLMQAMTDAGEKLGLSRETASRLTLADRPRRGADGAVQRGRAGRTAAPGDFAQRHHRGGDQILPGQRLRSTGGAGPERRQPALRRAGRTAWPIRSSR